MLHTAPPSSSNTLNDLDTYSVSSSSSSSSSRASHNHINSIQLPQADPGIHRAQPYFPQLSDPDLEAGSHAHTHNHNHTHTHTHTHSHSHTADDTHWPGRVPIGFLSHFSHSARQAAPSFPPRRPLSTASLTPAHTPLLTPSHPSASVTATSSSSSSSCNSSLNSTTTPTTSASSSSGSSSRNNSDLPAFAMSRIPPVGHAPVSAALQAQALEAMYERPSDRPVSSSPPPESEAAPTAPGVGAGSGYGSAGAMNNRLSSRRADASHRRRSHGHGPMRTPVRPHTPAASTHGGPTPPGRKPGSVSGGTQAAYNQPTRAFILERLHEYAPAALANPRTCDVRIVVPSKTGRQQQQQRPDSRRDIEPPTPQSASSAPVTPDGDGAAPSATPAPAAPPQAQVPVRFYALHRDYLVPQSSLFRTILTGGFKDGSAEVKGCKLLPYTSLHGPRPVFVPLPDPESFDALVHWMYFGDVAKLESQLSSGEVKWRGLIRNIQYLGCDERTRTVVAKWWQRWAQSERRAAGARANKDQNKDSDDEGDGEPGGGGVAVSRRRAGAGAGVPGCGRIGDDDDDDDDDGERESSYDNADDRTSSPWISTENLSYSVDADEMTRRLGGL